jgi:hypothetical protein
MRELTLDEVDHVAGGWLVELVKQVAISVIGNYVYDGAKELSKPSEKDTKPDKPPKEDDGSVPRSDGGSGMIDNGLYRNPTGEEHYKDGVLDLRVQSW